MLQVMTWSTSHAGCMVLVHQEDGSSRLRVTRSAPYCGPWYRPAQLIALLHRAEKVAAGDEVMLTAMASSSSTNVTPSPQNTTRWTVEKHHRIILDVLTHSSHSRTGQIMTISLPF